MAQEQFPISDVTNAWAAGGWDAVNDGTSPNDSDSAYSNDKPSSEVLEMLLTDLSGTPPADGTVTVHVRHAQVDGGTRPSSGGTAALFTLEIYEATTSRAGPTGTITANESSWLTDTSLTFNASVVSNWSDLRLRIVASGGGGSPTDRRGAAISWAKLVTPDASVALTVACTLATMSAADINAVVNSTRKVVATTATSAALANAATITFGSDLDVACALATINSATPASAVNRTRLVGCAVATLTATTVNAVVNATRTLIATTATTTATTLAAVANLTRQVTSGSPALMTAGVSQATINATRTLVVQLAQLNISTFQATVITGDDPVAIVVTARRGVLAMMGRVR